MNRLQSQFYVSFPVVQAEYTMIIMDIRAYARLLKNVRFIKYIKNRPAQMTPGCETTEILNGLIEFKQADRTVKPTHHEDLKELHLNVNLQTQAFILEPKDNTHTFYMMTEKFFWCWPTTNLGSGRHALLLDMQIKGIGRNPLAIRHDHSHSWGGHYLWQALKGYIISHLYQGVAPLGFLETPYIAAQNKDLKSKQIKSSAVAMAIREADALRVTQVMADFDPRERGNYELILKDFLKKNKAKSSAEHMEQIIFHYSAMLLTGLRHMAITRENVTLEGRLVDYEDIHLDTTPELYHCFMITHQCQKKMPKGTLRFKGEIVFTSTIHLYLDAIKLTAIGMNRIDPSFKMSIHECKKKFLKMIRNLGESVFNIDKDLLSFFALLLTRDAVYDKGERKPDLKNTDATEVLRRLKKQSFVNNLSQDLGAHQCNYYLIDFPRITFKNEFIENYNKNALMDAEPLIEKMFKMLQLESFSGKLDFDQMLNYSSECNKLLSQHALIFPYKLTNGKVSLKKTPIAVMEKQFKQKIKNELDATLNTFDYVIHPVSGDRIVRGANLLLKNGETHYTSISPSYMQAPKARSPK